MLQGERIFLRPLTMDDVTEDYVAWLNDPEISRYLESRWAEHSLQSTRSFVQDMAESKENHLFGIFLPAEGQALHIGNIKIGNVNPYHRYAEVGLIIGNKTAWGKGYGTEAIRLATRHAFETLGLNKLTAGMYAPNLGSYKAFLKAGWRQVGSYASHRYCDGAYVDEFIVEIVNDRNSDHDSRRTAGQIHLHAAAR
jgi:RimJ/RimL family protein N-acetyltransferase